jgi:hypothetical protein
VKRYGLFLTALAALALGTWSLHGARVSGPPRAAHPSASGTMSAAWDYHHSQARHWRNCLLQH